MRVARILVKLPAGDFSQGDPDVTGIYAFRWSGVSRFGVGPLDARASSRKTIVQTLFNGANSRPDGPDLRRSHAPARTSTARIIGWNVMAAILCQAVVGS